MIWLVFIGIGLVFAVCMTVSGALLSLVFRAIEKFEQDREEP